MGKLRCLVVGTLLASCSGSSFDEASSEKNIGVVAQPFSTASLSATPNPCLTANGASTCSTTVSWTSTYSGAQQVWVSVDSGAPSYFSCLPSGSSAPASWIVPGHSYRFELHPSASCATADRGVDAASINVTGYAARIVASQNPCSAAPSGSCTPTIGWASGYVAPAHQLWRTGLAVPVTCGNATSAGVAQAIPAGSSYHYDLYTATSTACTAAAKGTLVASLDVRAASSFVVKAGTGLSLAGSAYQVIGMNKHELIMQAQGSALGSWQTDLQDLAARGFKVVRLNGAPYWPVGIAEWVNPSTRAGYWAKIDAIVSYAGTLGIKLIPCILLNPFLFADAAGGEYLHATFAIGSSSAGRDLLYQYAQDLTTRYAANPTILYWELANELNLLADLRLGSDWGLQHIAQTDPPGQLGAANHLRSDLDDYSTDELAAFMRDFATKVHQWDPNHLVSSGYGSPRPSAMHLRRAPAWSASGPDWTFDTPAEMKSYVALIHPDPVDIVSMHVYGGPDGANDRFGATGPFNPDILDDYVAAADAIGKPLHLGEFGDGSPTVSVEPRANFTRRMALKALDLRIPVATVWTWKWLTAPTQWNDYSIYPGTPLMDDLITFLGNTNSWLVAAPRARSTVLPVPNANFTTDADGNAIPDSWTVLGPAGAVSIVDAPSPSFDGKTVYLYASSGGGVTLESSGSIPVAGGSNVVVSAGVRADLTAGGSANFGLFEVGNGLLTVLPLSTDAAFRVRAFQLHLQPSTTGLSVWAYTTGQGKLYIDDVRVSKIQ